MQLLAAESWLPLAKVRAFIDFAAPRLPRNRNHLRLSKKWQQDRSGGHTGTL